MPQAVAKTINTGNRVEQFGLIKAVSITSYTRAWCLGKYYCPHSRIYSCILDAKIFLILAKVCLGYERKLHFTFFHS